MLSINWQDAKRYEHCTKRIIEFDHDQNVGLRRKKDEKLRYKAAWKYYLSCSTHNKETQTIFYKAYSNFYNRSK